MDEDTTNVHHGTKAVKITLTGTTSYVYALTPCVTDGIGADLFMSAWAKKLSGTSSTELSVREYDTAACGTQLAANYAHNGDLTTDWTKYSVDILAATWNASTSSYRFYLLETGDGSPVIVADSAQMSTVKSDAGCLCNTTLTCSCSQSVMEIANPLTAGSWTVTATVRSPIDGAVATPARTIFYVPGTAGNNNRIQMVWASDVLTCTVYDQAGAAKTSTVAAAGAADTDYAVKMYHSADGRVGCCWDGTCDATEATAALIVEPDSTMYLGGTDTTGGEVWIDDLHYWRRVIR